jgi:type IV pilus biogenesis protein CpaD/CtpE
MKGGPHGSAIQAAVSHAHHQIAQLLLGNGADDDDDCIEVTITPGSSRDSSPDRWQQVTRAPDDL